MTDRGHTQGERRICGLFCLMALLLYTPAAQAAWLLLSGACCGTDRCPIAAHRHATEETGGAASDCGHAMGEASQAAACSISCCRIDGQPVLHAHLFLPAPALSFAASAPSRPAPAGAPSAAASLSPDPPIPPPKAAAAVR